LSFSEAGIEQRAGQFQVIKKDDLMDDLMLCMTHAQGGGEEEEGLLKAKSDEGVCECRFWLYTDGEGKTHTAFFRALRNFTLLFRFLLGREHQYFAHV
jgi:hypothetical protein